MNVATATAAAAAAAVAAIVVVVVLVMVAGDHRKLKNHDKKICYLIIFHNNNIKID